MKREFLKIRGARTHNLQNINLDIPKNKLVVITGVSGSGKSSLAFDTIYAEGQRRYVESLSAYARQFLGVMDKPDVDKMEGISPAIAIDQKRVSSNPRSTVGTATEIYDYLRLLFARAGTPYCPRCNIVISRQTPKQIVQNIKKMRGEILILAPLVRGRKGEHKSMLEAAKDSGFVRAKIDEEVVAIDALEDLELDPKKKHSISLVIDRMIIDKDVDHLRLVDSAETALKIGKGVLLAVDETGREISFSEHLACGKCGFSMPELEPRIFSFNSIYGACPGCSGLGTQMEIIPELVIPNRKLSLAEGAVKSWMNASHRVGRQGWYWLQLRELADRYNFSLFVPVSKLPARALEAVLYGDNEIEGVIPNLKRRYKETDSEWTRAELEKYMHIRVCPRCEGKRLKPEALAVKFNGQSIDGIVNMQISAAREYFASVRGSAVAYNIIKEITSRLSFLDEVGLSYLTLGRSSATLAGGEAQRIRLATQLGSRLSGVIYILDEPSIGLHARDQQKLLQTLFRLRDLGNSVVVVEHDPLTIRSADWIADIGEGAGKRGGKVVFQGTPSQLMRSDTLTGQYLSGKKEIRITNNELRIKEKKAVNLTIYGAREHNLKNIDVKIPLGKFVCVSGVSGSGKSSLVHDILAKALLKEYHGAHTLPGKHRKIQGLHHLNKAIVIDQSPIGRTPRSNPATYTGAFSYIRDLFSKTREARARGYSPGRFSFNVKGGRCETCKGGGHKKVEMFFLPDVYVVCDECGGNRYTPEALQIEYKGKNIAEVLAMSIDEAAVFFANIPPLVQKLEFLRKVGLGYVELGQTAPSLSGGEAQRVKLATELARKDTGRTLYILDEPTTGLHFEDVRNLLAVLRELVDKKNSVLVIEHNLDVLQNADWIIDLGPKGGNAGGRIIAEGPPAKLALSKASYTAKYLTVK